MSRYAVTGATGFVGGALARRLVRNGHAVRALARDPGRAGDLSSLGIELVAGDLAYTPALDALCAGVDGLFHVAGWYKVGSRDPEEAWAINVTGTRDVLAAAHRAQVSRIVYTSTLAVNSDTHGRVVDETYRFTGRHLSTYDETKAHAHRITDAMAAAGVPVVTAQPGLVYGPGDTSQVGGLVANVVAGRRPWVPQGGGYCWGFIDDIADGHVLAMERGVTGESYMLAGPVATLAESLSLAARISGTEGPRLLPRAMIRSAAAMVGATERVAEVPGIPAAETLRVALATYLGSPARAQRDLGWACRALEDGMADTVAALQS